MDEQKIVNEQKINIMKPGKITAQEFEQEFKELNIYLDDIYDYYTRRKGKDVGNLWIQFSDKFSAFKERLVNERKDKLPLEWSPVESEKKWQEEQFKILFPNIENDQPDWQRLNFFIEAALKYLEKNERKDNVGVNDAIEFAIYTNDKAWFDEDTGLWNLHDEEADPFRLTSGEMYQQFKLYSQPQQKEVDEEITAPSFEECPKCHHSLCICEIKGTI